MGWLAAPLALTRLVCFASARRGTLILAGGISVARWLLVLFSVCDRVIASEC